MSFDTFNFLIGSKTKNMTRMKIRDSKMHIDRGKIKI